MAWQKCFHPKLKFQAPLFHLIEGRFLRVSVSPYWMEAQAGLDQPWDTASTYIKIFGLHIKMFRTQRSTLSFQDGH